jgi:NADPH2:quinone reductase
VKLMPRAYVKPDPGPGEARVRHSYLAVNFIDAYFRTGRYPLSLPNG